MSEQRESWTIRHFSQANPKGPGQGDVPAWLRRVADTLAQYGAVEVQDIVLHGEVTAEGDWPSLTVYVHQKPGEVGEGASDR
jgi:hypothetical protein